VARFGRVLGNTTTAFSQAGTGQQRERERVSSRIAHFELDDYHYVVGSYDCQLRLSHYLGTYHFPWR
jgi:hypothetical protein